MKPSVRILEAATNIPVIGNAAMVNVRLVTNYAEKRYHVGSISARPCATKVHAIRAIRKLQSNAGQ